MPEPWGAASAWADIKPLAIPGAVEPSPPADPSPATGFNPDYLDGWHTYGKGGLISRPDDPERALQWDRGWTLAKALADRCWAVAEAEAPTSADLLGAVSELVAYENEVLAAGWCRLHDGKPSPLGADVRWCLERARDIVGAQGDRDLLDGIARMLGDDFGVPVMTPDESAAALAEMREQTARLQAATMPRPIDVDAEWVLARPVRDMIDRYAPWRDATPEVLARALEIEMAKGSKCRTSVVEKIKRRLAAKEEAS